MTIISYLPARYLLSLFPSLFLLLPLLLFYFNVIKQDGYLHIWNHTTKQHVLGHQAHEAAIIGLDYDQASNTYAHPPIFCCYFYIFYIFIFISTTYFILSPLSLQCCEWGI